MTTRSNPFANVVRQKLEPTKLLENEKAAARLNSPSRRPFNALYCNSFRISCCVLLACARALIPVWLSTWYFARSLVA
jgi:hypothetical protein